MRFLTEPNIHWTFKIDPMQPSAHKHKSFRFCIVLPNHDLPTPSPVADDQIDDGSIARMRIAVIECRRLSHIRIE